MWRSSLLPFPSWSSLSSPQTLAASGVLMGFLAHEHCAKLSFPPGPRLYTELEILGVGPNSVLFFFFFLILFLKLQYCISFAKYRNESATGIPVFPILNPLPSSLPIPSLGMGVVPVHQPQASSIVHRTWTGDSFHTWYYTCFNAILPNLPTLSLSHRLHKIYTSVSLLLSRTQGYCYHLSKFHIYALVYCIGVFLSGLLHSV